MSGNKDEIVVPPTWMERWEAEWKDGLTKMNLATFDWSKLKEQDQKLEATMEHRLKDMRFPQMKKQRMCWVYYIDYHRCLELKGEDWKPCHWFRQVYEDLCPKSWIETWDGYVEEGRFPAKFDR